MELGGDRQAEVRWISPVFHQPANTHQVTNIRHLTIQDLSCDQSGSVNCVMFEGSMPLGWTYYLQSHTYVNVDLGSFSILENYDGSSVLPLFWLGWLFLESMYLLYTFSPPRSSRSLWVWRWLAWPGIFPWILSVSPGLLTSCLVQPIWSSPSSSSPWVKITYYSIFISNLFINWFMFIFDVCHMLWRQYATHVHSNSL